MCHKKSRTGTKSDTAVWCTTACEILQLTENKRIPPPPREKTRGHTTFASNVLLVSA